MVLWLNGKFYDENEASIPANSAGMLLGWGVFSTLGVLQGRAVAAERHFARLRKNAAAMQIESAFDDAVLRDALNEVINHNQVQNGIARLTITKRGDGRWNREAGSDFSILAHSSLAPQMNGLCLILSPFRMDARRASAGIKSTSYADFQLASLHAQAQNCDEALLCNHSGAICEGARSNIFWARGNEILTPSLDCGCLPGIAREIVLEAAASLGISAHEGVFSLPEISGADEIFITAASTGPRGVVSFKIVDETHDFQSPGAVTTQFQHWWQRHAPML